MIILKRLARHAASFEDRLDGYNRWLSMTENEAHQDLILSQMSNLGKNKDQRKAVLITLCERYLENTTLSTSTKLLAVISDLIPQYINEHIDSKYKTVNDHRTLKGVMLNYKKMINILVSSNPIIAAAILKQGYLFLETNHATREAEGARVRNIYC